MDTQLKLASIIPGGASVNAVEIGGRRINYAKAGSGSPLLLIHGGNIGWGQWYPNIGELARYFTVYAIDLPGAGRSCKTDYTAVDFEKDFVDTAAEFIRKLGLEGADVVGSSNGGWVALKLALRGVKLNRLVLADSVGFSDYAGFGDRVLAFYPFARLLCRTVFKPDRSNKRIEDLLRSVFSNKLADIRGEFMEYFYETMSLSHNLLFISRLAYNRKKLFLGERLRGIKNKTLIVWGGKDAIMPLEKNRRNFGLIADSEARVIENAGHIPSLERSEEFNRLVINFLKPDQAV
jgi:4,5:9,10-diseco-3-hydroxy-5,9,17-trioxoandrosta-1(10),2-diene-4-oate hydrolase